MTREFNPEPNLDNYEYQQEYMLSIDDRFERYEKARIRDENRDLWDKSWPKPND